MSRDNPSFNSTRILRAYRLNNVENAKLKNQVFLLDKSKVREVRIANQDIRLIKLTLDYINSSSGHSPEGLPPNYVDTSKREELSPMFMYGERLVSRKFGKKFRRVQSAHAGHRGSDENLTNQEQGEGQVTENEAERKPRPKSSPAKAQATTFTGLRRSRSERRKLSPSHRGGEGGRKGVQRSSSLKHQGDTVTTETEPLTAVAIETARELSERQKEEDNVSNGRNKSVYSNDLNKSDMKRGGAEQDLVRSNPSHTTKSPGEDTKVPSIYLTEREDSKTPEGMTDSVYTPIIRRPKSRSRSQNAEKKQEMTRKVKEAREQVLHARKSKPDPTQAWAMPTNNPHKQQAVMDFKKHLNLDKNNAIQNKLKDFMQAYPVKKY